MVIPRLRTSTQDRPVALIFAKQIYDLIVDEQPGRRLSERLFMHLLNVDATMRDSFNLDAFHDKGRIVCE